MYTLKVSECFSKYPGGRFRTDGDNSGERFRDDFLIPALKQYEHVVIDLDGTLGYGSSFRSEVFSLLQTKSGMSLGDLLLKITIKSTNKTLVEEIYYDMIIPTLEFKSGVIDRIRSS